jgi:nucleoid-associated protein YgaU
MFSKQSRYYSVGNYVAKDARGNYNKVKRMRRINNKLDKALTYVVKEGDRLDLLAYRFYGDPTKFWLICDANQSMFPFELLDPGRRITIPQEKENL